MRGQKLPERESVKAVVFDIYGTLLQAGPGADDPEKAWAELGVEWFGCQPSQSWSALREACTSQVMQVHRKLADRGLDYPEVSWPLILRACLPELRDLSAERLEDFSAAWARIRHRTAAMPGAVEAVRAVRAAGLIVGVASNAQEYTRREADEAGLWSLGDGTSLPPDVSFWSYENEFSKPSSFVFTFLEDDLSEQGVIAEEILMIGDRTDNDIEPALEAGWQAWHFCPEMGRDWPCFCHWLLEGLT